MPHGPTFLCVQKRWHFLWWRKAIQGPKAVFPGTPHPNLAFTTHLKKTRASRSIDQLWYYSNRDGTWQTHHLDRGWRMTYWKLQGTWSFEKAGFCSVQRSLNVNHELYDQNEKPHFNIQIRNSSKLMFKRYESTYIDQQAWNNNLDLLEGTIKS